MSPFAGTKSSEPKRTGSGEMDGFVSTVTNKEPVKSTEDIGIMVSHQQEINGLDNVKADISRIVAPSESKPQRVEEDESETANQQNNTNDITRTAASPENSKLIESKTVKAKGRVEAGDGNDSSMEAGGDGSQDKPLPQGKEYWYCYHCC